MAVSEQLRGLGWSRILCNVTLHLQKRAHWIGVRKMSAVGLMTPNPFNNRKCEKVSNIWLHKWAQSSHGGQRQQIGSKMNQRGRAFRATMTPETSGLKRIFGEIGRKRKSFVPFRDKVFTAFVPFGLVKEWFGWLAEETRLWKFAGFNVPRRRINITFYPPIELLSERLPAECPEMQLDQEWEFLKLGIHLPPWLDGTGWREETAIRKEDSLGKQLVCNSGQSPWSHNVAGYCNYVMSQFCDVFACINKSSQRRGCQEWFDNWERCKQIFPLQCGQKLVKRPTYLIFDIEFNALEQLPSCLCSTQAQDIAEDITLTVSQLRFWAWFPNLARPRILLVQRPLKLSAVRLFFLFWTFFPFVNII